jgi:hypothetical protein
VACVAGRIDTGQGDTISDDEGHRFPRKSLQVDVAVPIHGPEDGTIVDLGRSQPVVEASYGAVPRAAIGDADLPTCPLPDQSWTASG